MNACPTPETISRYRAGTLNNTEETRAFDDHLRACPACRASLRRQTAYAAIPLAISLTPPPEESIHLDDAQMLAYARGQSDDVEHEIVESHIQSCRQCRADVAELTAFHEKMRDANFSHLEERLAHPTLRERCEIAFHAMLHAVSAGSLQSALTAWNRQTLTIRLLLSIVLGALVGFVLRGHTNGLLGVQDTFLSLLQALATPFIFVAIVYTLMDADVTGRTARRLAYLALSNTFVAVCIGLLVGNAAKPGAGKPLARPESASDHAQLSNLTAQVPRLHDNNILFAVLIAVAIGLVLRAYKQEQVKAHNKDYQVIGSLIASVYRCLTIMLNWVVSLVPIAVFAVVATLVGQQKWLEFHRLLNFSAAVIFALVLQISFYLIRLWFRAGMRPQQFLPGAWAAILTAFSTASSAATLPVTYTSVRDGVGVRERSAGLGVLVGAHFNRDGTALYEAITPIFIAQLTLHPLDLQHQLIVVGMAILASIAAPGIPGAGLITMLLVFQAVGLPTEYIALLLPIDWFLDRCRTAVNVLGGMTITCLLDRRAIPYSSDDHEEALNHEEALEPEVVD